MVERGLDTLEGEREVQRERERESTKVSEQLESGRRGLCREIDRGRSAHSRERKGNLDGNLVKERHI